ncbi:hypothetical protein GCM10028777_18430 [Angustibacter speluncae]
MTRTRARRGAGDDRAPRPDVAADRDADPASVARRIVLDQLAVRARSRAELATTLARRGVPDEVATSVLDRMEQVDLVDDEAFAHEWVRSRQRSKGLSGRALRLELHRKGIDTETAAVALAGLDPDDERAAARELVERKARATRGLDQQVRVRRLAGMLARKGYGSDVALGVVREVLGAEDDLSGDDDHPEAASGDVRGADHLDSA